MVGGEVGVSTRECVQEKLTVGGNIVEKSAVECPVTRFIPKYILFEI